MIWSIFAVQLGNVLKTSNVQDSQAVKKIGSIFVSSQSHKLIKIFGKLSEQHLESSTAPALTRQLSPRNASPSESPRGTVRHHRVRLPCARHGRSREINAWQPHAGKPPKYAGKWNGRLHKSVKRMLTFLKSKAGWYMQTEGNKYTERSPSC